MQFHPTGTDPTPTALLVCRNVRWNLVILLAILWAVPVFWWYVAAPLWVLSLCTALPLLLTWPMVSAWRKRGSADNWVLALYGDGIWLNLRDCDYNEAEPAETVVFLPYREVAAARRVVHRYTTPSSDNGTTAHRDVYLELQLTTGNGALTKALADERRRDPPQHSHLGGHVTSQTRRTQFPIEMESDNAIRIKFSVASYGLRPKLRKVLAALQKFVIVETDQQDSTGHWRTLDDLQFESLVRRLIASGDRMNAVALLRRRKGISLAAARELVAGLAARERQPASE